MHLPFSARVPVIHATRVPTRKNPNCTVRDVGGGAIVKWVAETGDGGVVEWDEVGHELGDDGGCGCGDDV